MASRFLPSARRHPPRGLLLLLGSLGPAFAAAQSTPDATPTTLDPVMVTAPKPSKVPSIAGFVDRPLEALPLQATIVDRQQLDDNGARRLADLTRFDASVSDAYNSFGYWDYLTVRGYVLDPRFNYRREGLPISGETAISLANKERVELLKGSSGIQAGTSAPGGLANYIVKRPTAEPLRRVTLGVGDRGSVNAAVDLGGRAGLDDRFGYRVNVAVEDRRPEIDGYGHLRSRLAAVAADWRLATGSLLEAEVEWSRQTGASLPGYSLLGSTLPAPRHPGNLNNQPWSQPNVFDGLTGSLRYDQTLAGDWHWVTQIGTQRLRSDDRLAYPFGFDCHPDSDFTWCDRYSPDGEYDIYDFRSEGERRRTHALQTTLQGSAQTGFVRHELHVGLLGSRLDYRFNRSANNYVGSGNVDGTLVTPADPRLTDDSTNREESSSELFVNDRLDWGHGLATWVGLRHTRMHRESVRTDGSRATDYSQSVTTPWLAASWNWAEHHTLYASWGEGAESAVVPGRADRYDNAGVPLPVLKSRQWEVGVRGGAEAWRWGLAWFDIDRPAITDAPPVYRIDGSNRHRGAEGTLQFESGPWSLRGSAMWIDAKRRNAADTTLNGQRPVNVPRQSIKAQGEWRLAALPGAALQAGVVHEGRRNVLPDGSIELPSWTRFDLGASLRQQALGARLTWRLGVDNVFNRQAWKESPTQFGHVYLFPLEARALRLSVQADL